MASMLSNSKDVVIELIENTDVNDASMSNYVAQMMREQGVSIALDDVGAPDTMISLNILSDVDYIKFDRHWLNGNNTPSMQLLLKSFEGVESAEDLAYAVNVGVDLVQGYFYQELFISESCGH